MWWLPEMFLNSCANTGRTMWLLNNGMLKAAASKGFLVQQVLCLSPVMEYFDAVVQTYASLNVTSHFCVHTSA
jgi:hypothetical protein